MTTAPTSSLGSALLCTPRFATPRNYSRKTLGPLVGEIASALGTPLMPWQQYVADVALEIDPDTGLLAYREIVLTVPRQSGKDLAVTTPILTTDGWKTMGTVQAGDYVYGPDGKPTRVVFTSEVFTDHKCYELEFGDGAVIVAGEDHLWRVWDKDASGGGRKAKAGRWRTMSTKDLVSTNWKRERSSGRVEYRYRVACDAVVETPEADLPIDPYIFGYWLGDGTSTSAQLTVGEEDLQHVRDQITSAGYRVSHERKDPRTGAYTLSFDTGKAYDHDGIVPRLKSLGVFGDKHIPEVYLTASPDQRKALLAGLLDSDGSISHNARSPRVEFCGVSKRLSYDVLRLARSLGIKTSMLENDAKISGLLVGTRYRIAWTPTFNPFRLVRKSEKFVEPMTDRYKWMSIVDIREVPTVLTRCIQVDNPEHVFLVGEQFTPTHNTTLLLAAMVHRALGFGQRQRVLYTAQNRISARKKWEDEHVQTILSSKDLKKLLKTVRRQLGQEAIIWKNGSTHGIESNTDKAGHGETLDMGVIDEAFAQEDDRLEQAFKPAMITRAQPQLWVLSTAGTSKSTYLRSKVDAGRAQVAAGLSEGVCYFEWSAPPDADPSDPATWWACMPALGHTVTEEAVAGFYQSMKLSEFRRAFLNQWPDDAPDEWTVIKRPSWDAIEDSRSEIFGSVAFAVDVTPDRKFGSIAVVGRRADGLRHVEIVAHQNGTGWIPETVRKLHRTWKPVAVVIDASGPAGSVIAEIESHGIEVVKPTIRDIGQACGQFYDAVVPADGRPTLRHIGQAELNAALAGATKRHIKDVWAWNRRGLSVDISPLVASTLALWGFTSRSGTKKNGSKPKVAFI